MSSNLPNRQRPDSSVLAPLPKVVPPQPPPLPTNESQNADRWIMPAVGVAGLILILLLVVLIVRITGDRLRGQAGDSVAGKTGGVSAGGEATGITGDAPIGAESESQEEALIVDAASEGDFGATDDATSETTGGEGPQGSTDSDGNADLPEAQGLIPTEGSSTRRTRVAAFADPVAGASFFGLEQAGNNFVFVIDRSISMSGARLDTAKRELLIALSDFQATQKFSVVFFSDEPLVDPRFINANANRETIDDLRSWLQGVSVDGSTYPFAAMQMALQAEPDAIFLLSDGEFDSTDEYQLLSTLRTTKPAAIHGVSMEIDSASLREITRLTGGQYRRVDLRLP